MRKGKSPQFRFTHTRCPLCAQLVPVKEWKEGEEKVVRFGVCEECREKRSLNVAFKG